MQEQNQESWKGGGGETEERGKNYSGDLGVFLPKWDFHFAPSFPVGSPPLLQLHVTHKITEHQLSQQTSAWLKILRDWSPSKPANPMSIKSLISLAPGLWRGGFAWNCQEVGILFFFSFPLFIFAKSVLQVVFYVDLDIP